MKPNEIIGTIGIIMYISSLSVLLFFQIININLVLTFVAGIIIQFTFLSWWGLETFNNWVRKLIRK